MIRFSDSHPVVLAFYFISVLLVTMFTLNPILLCLALGGSVLFFAKAERYIRFWKEFGFSVAVFLIVCLTNPLFSHNGVTPLFFLNGNPVTLEALLYGVNIAVMVVGVLYWFKCFNLVMTSDKLLFLLGKIFPKISLLLCSALRFIPLLKHQSEKIRQSQKAMGLFASDTWLDKLKGSLRVYSALITWGMENAIDIGSAMKGRGYGLKGRSHYSIFSFTKRDVLLIAIVVFLDGVVFTALAKERLDFSFYPAVTATSVTPLGIGGYTAFGLLTLLPFIMEVKESLQWKHYISKI